MATTTTSAASSAKPLLGVHVTIRVAPASVPAFLDAFGPCQAGCLTEPECMYFDVFHDGQGTFRFVELWTLTREQFQNIQMNKPYYEPYLTITKPMWVEDRRIEYFDQMPGYLGLDRKYVEGRIRE